MINMTASGNLTKDAISREVSTQNGVIYAVQFTIAMNEKGGENENATFLPCTYWSKSDKIVPHLTKGKPVIVLVDWYENQEHEGRYYQNFRVRKLEFQRGEKSNTPPISSPPPGSEASTTQQNTQQSPSSPQNGNVFQDDQDDDLPF